MSLHSNLLCGTIALLALSFSLGVHAEMVRPRPASSENRDLRLYGDLQRSSTESNFDASGGAFERLSNGRYYRQWLGTLGAEYRLAPDFGVLGDLGYARAESFDGNFERFNSSLTELTLGVRWLHLTSPLSLTSEVLGGYPFNRVDETTDDVLTGEGAAFARAGAWAEAAFSLSFAQWQPYAYLGFQYQDGGRASHYLTRLGSDFAWKTWSLGFALDGRFVAIGDAETDTATVRDTVTDRVNGGSRRFYAVNPSWLTAEVMARLALAAGWQASLGLSYDVNGKSASQGFGVLLGFMWTIRTEDDVREEFITPSEVNSPTDRQLKKFRPESPENYDPTLFDEKPAAAPKPEASAKPPKKKRRPKTKKPVDIDQSLEDVQKSLEN